MMLDAAVQRSCTTFVDRTLAGFGHVDGFAPVAHDVSHVMCGDVTVWGSADVPVQAVIVAGASCDIADEVVELFVAGCSMWSFPNLHPDSMFALDFSAQFPDPQWPFICVSVAAAPRGAGRWLDDTRVAAKAARSSPESFSFDNNLSGFYANAQLDRLGSWCDAGVDLLDAARMHMVALGCQVAVHEAFEQTVLPSGGLVCDPHVPGSQMPVTVTFSSGVQVVGSNLACW
jgi:hypothetical protein